MVDRGDDKDSLCTAFISREGSFALVQLACCTANDQNDCSFDRLPMKGRALFPLEKGKLGDCLAKACLIIEKVSKSKSRCKFLKSGS